MLGDGKDATAEPAILRARNVVKEYPQGEGVQRVLDRVDLDVAPGAFVAVMGPSGSGKSTLLHLLGGLDVPDEGEVELDGESLSSLDDEARTLLRRHRVGVVYQFFNLVPVLTAAENIALPAVIAGRPERDYAERLEDVLALVGLTEHRQKEPAQLSGGQQQRAAIGRALFVEPAVLLADEPTGNLDLASGADVLDLFVVAQRDRGQTIVMVTHDPRSAAYADEVLLLRDGRVTARLDVARRCRGAARTERHHPARPGAVLRWLEDLDAHRSAVRGRSARPLEVT